MKMQGVMRHGRATASVASVSLFSTALVGLAVAYPGTPTADITLTDGGVWVTNAALSLLGHLNVQAGELDSSLRAQSNTFDVLQQANTVLLSDTGAGAASAVDVADVVLTGTGRLPAGATMMLGAQTVAITSPDRTTVWVLGPDEVATFDADAVDPTATFDGPIAAAVGQDGTVHVAVPAEHRLLTYDADGAETADPLPDSLGEADLQVTAVGAHVVLMDPAAGAVSVDGHTPVRVDGAAGGRLQQPGADATAVEIAGPDALLDVPLDGTAATRHEAGATGSPAAPVRLNGCTYAAWSGSGRYVRDCDGTDADVTRDIASSGSGELRFRVNRDVVALNDLQTGAVWLTDDALTQVNNWQQVEPKDKQQDEQQEDTSEDSRPDAQDRTQPNQPPSAADDHFGVRPGRTTVLPVLANDTDPDGDVLTAGVKTPPPFGTLEAIRHREAFQITVPEDRTGSTTFVYTAGDGRQAGTDDATVTVEVRPTSVEEPPEQGVPLTLVVEQGRTASVNVLPGWSDPDGDDLFLESAVPTSEDQVRFTPDGEVTFTDVGTSQGRKEVSLVVSDGQQTTEGRLVVDVLPAGNKPPVANADHADTVVGRPVTISPLDNDTDANGDVLRLAGVDEVEGLQIDAKDFAAGSFTVTPGAAQTFYVAYTVTDGPSATTGVVRIDAAEPPKDPGTPVAVRDTALLPAGGVVYLDPLVNDEDPTGGVLVVQGTSVPADSPLTVAVIDHHLLRVSAQAALSGPVSFSYVVSNGSASSTGTVVVLPVPAPAKVLPPVAVEDTAVVRVGDVVSIDVLDNDSSPSEADLSVVHDLPQAPEAGVAFVSGDQVRFEAPAEPTTVHLVYSVTDPEQQVASAQVTITVRPVEEVNSPPHPADVLARALAGQAVRVPIPLDGTDPDGDSVQLVGLASAPTKGQVVTVGASWLDYEASKDGAGTDEFTYQVVDRLGQVATGRVRVGIAPAAATNQRPVAVPDTVRVRPGRTLAVPVLSNDVDADGDQLTLVKESLESSDPSVSPTVSGDRVQLTTPGRAGTVTVYYRVTDGKTGEVTGSLAVTVDPEAPALSPIARDDLVAAADVAGTTSTTVDVLVNDDDPDGDPADLTVTAPDGVVVGSDGALTVPVTDALQSVRYTVTDVDGIQSSAFVWVPGTDDLRPRLRSTTPVEVASGALLTLPLADYVDVAPGRTARVTTAESVSALHGNGAPVLQDATTLVFTSADRYFGPAGVTFEVTDGTGPDDPAGHKAWLTIPIKVLPPANQPPAFTGSTVQVAPGEAAATVDLTALTADPDEGDLARVTYTLAKGDFKGLSVEVKGQSLVVSAGVDVPKGTTVTLDLTISDGTSDPARGQETIQVVASSRPFAVANPDTVERSAQGKTVSVDVLANDTNPFAETPLAIVDVAVETGTGTARLAGDKVEITPGAAFVGTMVVRYRVQDATKDPDRQVDGRATVNVQGVPDQPGTPTVSEVRSKTVVLGWAAPANNGAPITAYAVRSNDGRSFPCGTTTTCTLEGLSNDVSYTFTVTATNEVGDSPASPPSAPARPDQKPTAPNAPTLVFGDQSLVVSWVAPTGYEGSPATAYTLEISPPPPSGVGQVRVDNATTYTWGNLANGTPYQVRVQAINQAPEPSEWSAYSATMVPARVPDAPAQPATARLSSVGAQSQLQVSWAAPAANGDPIATYTLHVLRGGAEVSALTVPGGTTQQVVTLEASDTDYTFTVAAMNKAGTGAASPASAARRLFGIPGAVGGLTATPGDNSVALSYGAAAGNGLKASEISYQYQVNGGAWTAMPGDKVVRSGVGNNGTYTVGVRAVGTLDGVTAEGPGADAAPVAPYGPPLKPGARAGGNATSVTLFWDAPGRNGRDFHLEISIDHGGWENVGAGSGSRVVGNAYSDGHSIRVRTVDEVGQVSAEAGASAQSGPRPSPHVWLTRDGANAPVGKYLVAHTENLPAGRYDYKCYEDDVAFENGSGPIDMADVDFPANSAVQLGCYAGTGLGTITIKIFNVPGYGTVVSDGARW